MLYRRILSCFDPSICLVAVILLLIPTSAHAVSYTLTASDGGGTSSFDSDLHWPAGAGAPSAGNDYSTGAFDLRTPEASNDQVFLGDILNVNTSGRFILKMGGNNQVTVSDLRLDGGTVFHGVGGRTYTLAGAITAESGGATFYSGNSTDRTLNVTAPISGVGAVTIDGQGTVNLSGANSYTGDTIVDGGILRLGSAGAIPAGGSVIVNGGTLDAGGISNLHLSNVTIQGSGANAVTGALANTGNGGAYAMVDNLTLAGNASIGSNVGGPGNGPGRIGLNGSIDLAGYTLTKVGSSEIVWRPGTLTSGTGGNLVINGGGVNVERDNSLPTTTVNSGGMLSSYGGRTVNAAVTLNNGSTMASFNGTNIWTGPISLGAGEVTMNAGDSAAYSYYNDGNLMLSGKISGAGGIRKVGDATVTFNGGTANSYSGMTTITDGTLVLAKNDNVKAMIGDVQITGGTLQVNTTGQFSNNSNITIDGGTFDLRGSGYRGGAGSIHFLSGTVVDGDGGGLSQLNLYADSPAAFLIRGGLDYPLRLAIESTNANGITFDATNNGTATISGTAVTLANGDKTITVQDGTADVDLHISAPIIQYNGSFGFTKLGAGTLELSNGGSSYTGGTTINGGTLRIGATGATGTGTITILGSSIDYADGVDESNPIDLQANATLNVTTGSATQSGAIGETGGSYGISKTGAGSLTLSGANTYTGITYIDAGILKAGNGTALGTTAGGTIIASGATLDVNGQNLGSEQITVSGTGVGGAGAIINTSGSPFNVGNVTMVGDTTFGGTARWDIRTGAPSTLDMGGFKLTKTGGNQVSLVDVAVSNSGNIDIQQGTLNLETSTNLGGSAANTITIGSGGTLQFWNSSQAHEWSITSNGGQIRPASSHATWNGPITLNGTTTIDTDNYNGGASMTINGQVGGSGGIKKIDTGTLTLTGDNTYTGTTTVNQGTLIFDGGSLNASATGVSSRSLAIGPSSGATVTIKNGADLTLGGWVSVGYSTNGDGTLNLEDGSLTINGLSGGNPSDRGLVIGEYTGTTGTFNMSGGSLNVANTLWISQYGSGVWNISGGDASVGKLSLGSEGSGNGTLNLTGGVITIGSGGITKGNGTATVNLGGGTLAASADWSSSLPMTLTGTGGDTTIDTNGNLIVLSNALSGTGGLIKTGAGTLRLDAQNTYTGGTTVDAGTLQLNSGPSNTGTIRGTVTVNSGGTLESLKWDSFGYNGPQAIETLNINGGTVTHSPAANLTLGQITINMTGGLLQTTDPGGRFDFLNDDVVINTLGSSDTATIAGRILLRSSQSETTFNVADGSAATDLLVSAVISQQNAGHSILKTGDGTMTMTAANTYSGTTTITGGTLQLGASNVIPDGSAVVILNNGSTLEMAGYDDTVASFSVNPTTAVGGGNYHHNGGETLNVTGDMQIGGDNQTGTVHQDNGTINVANLIFGGSTSNVKGGTYNLDGGALNVAGDIIEGTLGTFNSSIDAAQLQVDGGTLTVGGNIQVQRFSLGQDGGTLGSYTVPAGQLVATSGTLSVGSNGTGLLDASASGVTLINSNVYVGEANNSNGTIIVDGGNSWTIDQFMKIGQNNIGLVELKSGTLTINGASGSTKGLIIADKAGSNGTLIIGVPGGSGSADPVVNVSGGNTETANNGTGAITMHSGTFNQLTNNLIVGQINGSDATFTLNDGTVNVTNQLRIANNGKGLFVQNGGTVNVGAAMDIANDVLGDGTYQMHGGTLNASSNLIIGNRNSTTASAQMEVYGGTVNITGSLRIADNGVDSSGTLIVGDGTTSPKINLNNQFESADNGTGTFIFNSGTFNETSGNFITGQNVNSTSNVTIGGGTTPAEMNITNDWNTNGGHGIVEILPNGTVNVGGKIQLGNSTDANSGLELTINGGTVNVGGNIDYRSNGPKDLITLADGVLDLTGGNIIFNGAADSQFVMTGGELRDVNNFGSTLNQDGGTLMPGSSPGIMTITGNYNLNAGTLQIEFDGNGSAPVAGTDYDQLQVGGDVNIATTATALSTPYLGTTGNFNPVFGEVFTIIANNGTNPVTGAFGNLPTDGSEIFVDNKSMKIYYAGGDGNDVVLVSNSGTISTLYVNDQWSTPAMVDGDLEQAGLQTAYVDTNAFGDVASALAVEASPTLILNGGNYANVDLSGGNVAVQLTADLAGGENNITVGTLTGQAGDSIDIGYHDAGVGNLIVEQGTFAGVMTGSGSLTKTTGGTLVLSGLNTYTGGTIVDGGILALDASSAGSGALPGGHPVTVNSATLRLDRHDAMGYYGGNPSMVTLNNSTLTTNGYGDHSSVGNFTLNEGTITAVGAGSGTGNYIFDGTIYTVAAANSSYITATKINVRDGGYFDVADGAAAVDLMVTSDFTGNRIYKQGDGTMVMTGNSTIGTIHVDRAPTAGSTGVLQLADNGSTTVNGLVGVGYNGSGSALLSIVDNHQLTVNGTLALGQQSGIDGQVIQSDNSSVTVRDQLRVGHYPNETSTYTINGGTLTITGTSTSNPFTPNVAEKNGAIYLGIDGTGILNQNGGTISAQGMVLDNRGNTAGTDTYTMTGGTLTLGQWGIQGNASTQINLGGGTVAASADWSSSMPMTLTGTNGAVSFDTNGNDISLSGDLTGGGGLIKRGDGTLTLSGNNALGNVQVQRDTGNSTLVFAGNGSSTASHLGVGNPMNIGGQTGVATVIVQDNHNLSVNGYLLLGERQNNAGNMDQTGGTVSVTNQIRIGHWSNETSTYDISAGQLNSSGGLYVGWDGSGIMNVSGTADVNTTAGTYVQRNSTLTIGGNSTFDTNYMSIGDSRGAGTVIQNSGDVTVGGELRIGHYPNSGSYTINDGTLTVTGTGTGPESQGVITIGVDGHGILNQNGGTITTQGLYLDSRGASGGVDQYNMTDGTLVLTSGLGISGNANTSTYAVNLGGGTIIANANTQIATPATLTGTGGDLTIDTNGNTLTVNNVLSGSGGLIKEGTGTLEFTTRGTYSGNTVVNDGLLRLVAPNAAASTIGTGTLTINSGATVETGVNGFGWTYQTPVIINSGTLRQITSGVGPDSHMNTVSMTAGTWTGEDAAKIFNVHRDVTVNAAAASSVMSVARFNLSPDGTAVNPGTITFDVADGAAPIDLLVSGVLSAGGGLTKTGDGTMVLTGTNTYSGATSVVAGTLQVGQSGAGSIVSPTNVGGGATLAGTGVVSNAVTVNSGATVSPGDQSGGAIGTLTVDSATFNPGSTLAIQLDPSSPGNFTPTGWGDVSVAAASDTLDVSGDLTLAGTLDLSAVDNAWARGQEFNILDFILSATNDADGDGVLDTHFDNYIIPYLNEDGYATLTHDELISGQFLPDLGENGEGLGGYLSWDFTDLYTQGIIRIVPEPSTWAIFGLGLLALGWFRRRKK